MPNRLASATSPYLLQHRENPVDWHEWGPEAFEEARRRSVPLLVSVGYSSCHWCHVMAHESFEDPETAAEMNRLFVNVKVDREERPDVDSIYMEAVQAMTGHGGWPMTVWLTPDGRPFYAGTYFPPIDRHGLPSFRRVMAAIADAWSARRAEVEEQASRITETIARELPPPPAQPDLETMQSAYRSVEAGFDYANGGFGGAPKFPQQPVLEFLLRVGNEPWAPRASEMVRITLERMAAGGIHDQLGGGFARYSVDRQWHVPHFEKMLYDNAQLARIFLWAGVELGMPGFLAVARSTLGYLLRDLRHPSGGFYSAEDADSEGEEGKFYVWSHDDLLEAVGPDEGPAAAFAFGVTPGGNFEGANVLTRRPDAAVVDRYGSEAPAAVERARVSLLETRSKRVRPGLDDKVIAAWNGLAVRALAEAGAALDDGSYLDSARACAHFVLDRMTVGDRLHRSWRDGSVSGPGFLDDQAAMALGLFSLYAATGELEWFEAAARLTEEIPRLFSAPGGGFFSTASDAERLVKRPKDQYDNPLPSGNSLAAEALLLHSLYTGDSESRRLAEEAVGAAAGLMERYPSGVGHMLSVLWVLEAGPRELAISGPAASDLARVAWERFRPDVAMAIDPRGKGADLVPLLRDRFRPGQTLAYVCRDFACLAPVATAEELRAQLG